MPKVLIIEDDDGVRFAELLRSIVATTNTATIPGQRDFTEQRAADRVPVPGMQLLDLDLNKVRQHIAVATERRGYDGATEPMSSSWSTVESLEMTTPCGRRSQAH